MAGETMALSGGNAGVQPPASGVVGSPACFLAVQPPKNAVQSADRARSMLDLALPMQPQGQKRAPLPDVFAGRGGGDGAYVHTDRNISPEFFFGRSIDGYEIARNRERFKHLANISHALSEGGESEAGMRLLGCGRWFRRMNFTCGTYKLVPYPCDSMFCPECAARRSKPLQDRILARMDQTNCDYFFLTVTVKSWEELTREKIDRLIEMFGELRESDEWRRAGISGGVYSIESTYTHAGWHPHLHILIETKRGAFAMHHVDRFKERWLKITGDSFVIHLAKMYGIAENGGKTPEINSGALRELVKYATKASTFSRWSNRVLEFFNAFRNVRRMQAFGNFLGAVKEAEQEEKEKEGELVGCACGLCRWKDAKPAGLFHISQTVLAFDGTRQLRLFDSGLDPPIEVVNGRNAGCDFSIAWATIPKTQPLFDVAPLAF